MKIIFKSDDSDQVVEVAGWDVPENMLAEVLNITACAKLQGLSPDTVKSRIRRGWPVLMALATEEE